MKYGESHMFQNVTRDYEQVINLAGVISSESGCVRVYIEDDKFTCPNCQNKANPVDEMHESKLCMLLFILELDMSYSASKTKHHRSESEL